MNEFEFAAAWESAERSVRVYIASTIFHPQDRDDLLQAVAITAWRKIGCFNPDKASFKTWVVGIAKFECLNYLRRQSGDRLIFGDKLLDAIEIEVQAIDDDGRLLDQLGVLLAALPPEKLQLLRMKYFERLGTSTIAASLGVSEAAVKERLLRIRKELRQNLRNAGYFSTEGADTLYEGCPQIGKG